MAGLCVLTMPVIHSSRMVFSLFGSAFLGLGFPCLLVERVLLVLDLLVFGSLLAFFLPNLVTSSLIQLFRNVSRDLGLFLRLSSQVKAFVSACSTSRSG